MTHYTEITKKYEPELSSLERQIEAMKAQLERVETRCNQAHRDGDRELDDILDDYCEDLQVKLAELNGQWHDVRNKMASEIQDNTEDTPL